MKIWIGGIIDAVIADEFRLLRNSLEERINRVIISVDYGSGMSTWDVILVISSSPPNEYIRYNKASKETDIRLIVDFDAFLLAQSDERLMMMKQTLLNSIEYLSGRNIINFDFQRLQQDVINALNTGYAF